MNTGAQSDSRFEDDANRYAAYLETTEGRLRSDVAFANLQEFLPPAPAIASLLALDLGCGTGAAGIRLGRLGAHVTLLDSSPAMLGLAERTIAQAGLWDKITVVHGDAGRLTDLPERSFDIILCHHVLEFAGDPAAVLRGVQRAMRDSSSILSLVVRNQAGEVLKAALQTGDLAAAEHSLTADCAQESLYGGNVRLFTPEALDGMLKDASLTTAARRGVRVIADYLPARISRTAEYDRIFALECKLGRRPEFFGIARYLHYLCRGS